MLKFNISDGTKIQKLDIFDVPSRRRNPIIADIFHRLDYMERRGSGFKKICDAVDNIEDVKFYSNSSEFKVTLYNQNYKNNKNNNKIMTIKNGDKNGDKNLKYSESVQLILKYLEKNDYITTTISLDVLNLKSKSRARLVLNQMTKEGIINAEGENRNRKYKRK